MYGSLMMIGLAPDDREPPVELLGKKKPYHLMRERHPRQGKYGRGLLFHRRVESERSSDNENQLFTSR